MPLKLYRFADKRGYIQQSLYGAIVVYNAFIWIFFMLPSNSPLIFFKHSLLMLSSHVNLCFLEALRLNIFICLFTLGSSCPIPDDILFLDSHSVQLCVLDVHNTDFLLFVIQPAICWCTVTP